MKFKIKYSIANHRGTIRVIPENEDARFLCEMNNTKTITAAMLRTIGEYYPDSILYTAEEDNGRWGAGALPTINGLRATYTGRGPLIDGRWRSMANFLYPELLARIQGLKVRNIASEAGLSYPKNWEEYAVQS